MKITICGSMAFYKEMGEVKSQLESLGHEVLIPLLELETPPEMGGNKWPNIDAYIRENGGMDAFPMDHWVWNVKQGGIQDHFNKVEKCEAILVTNYDKRGITGYIGGNTLLEIGLAFYLKKKIYILNQISSELSYRQEIYGMKPVIIDGDLTKII